MSARVVLALAVALCAPTQSARAQVPDTPLRTVLTIHLGPEHFPANPVLDAGIRDTLASRSDLRIDYFAEYLESDSFRTEAAAQAFSNYIRRKYEGRRIDLVIAITDTALRFVLDHRAKLFPHAHVVFAGLAVPGESIRNAGSGLTGIRLGIAYGETLKLALRLLPDTERVFVVAKGSDEQTMQSVRDELRGVSQQVSVEYLNEERLGRLIAAVQAIPPRSVILYIWQTHEEPGRVIYADVIARLVAHAASVPVYGTSDLYLGSGVVGGVVRGTRETGIRLGDIALRILTGTRPQDIPVEAAKVRPVLDWRELRRWGISEARVPAGAHIRFREPTAWERYRFYVTGAVVVLLMQTALIAGLLVERARRRLAEADLRGHEAVLRTSYERIHDLGGRLLKAQETERARIARELHDDIGQQLALLEIDLQVLSGAVEASGEQLAEEAVQRAHTLARSVHALSHRLHPAMLHLIGLVAALDGLVRELSRPDIRMTFTHASVPPTLPSDLTLCLFRVAQEALQNALKYSGAGHVSVELRGRPDGLQLTIVDNGMGFDVGAAWGSGLGLVSMAERVEAVGGTIGIRSRPGTGTRLEVTVPVRVVQSAETMAS